MAQAIALASGTTAANSADVVVTTPTTLSLFSGETDQSMARCKLSIYLKDSNSNYHRATFQRGGRRYRVPIDLTNVERTVTLTEPGTYRVVRPITTTSVGVNADT